MSLNLIEMAGQVCTKVQQPDSGSLLLAAKYIRRRHHERMTARPWLSREKMFKVTSTEINDYTDLLTSEDEDA